MQLSCDVGTTDLGASFGMEARSPACASSGSPRWSMEELVEAVAPVLTASEAECEEAAAHPTSVAVLDAAREECAVLAEGAVPHTRQRLVLVSVRGGGLQRHWLLAPSR